jgi:predicted HicB family RNase H-like nuclease
MTRKRRGRPPLDPADPSAQLNVRVPSRQYDAAYTHARAERLSLAAYVRRLLRAAISVSRNS